MSIKRLVPLNVFSASSAPSGTHSTGDMYYNTTNGILYVHNGSGWGPTDDSAALNVLYVSKSGSDSNDGTTLGEAKLTIKSAAGIATPGTTIFVKSGDYYEDNPIQLDKKVAIVGDSLRTVNIRPLNTTQDIFWVQNGDYITEVTFRGHEAPSFAVAFNPDGSAGLITSSPYVHNASSITTTGGGMHIDGSKVTGLKSMVLDSFTQFNSGGPGIVIDNQGYGQLVSIFTICTTYGVWVKNGSTCSITNSNNSFGTYGLVAEGVGNVRDTGELVGDTNGTQFVISGLSGTPFINEGITFDDGVTYYTVRGATPPVAGVSTVTTLESVREVVLDGAEVTFRPFSFISASGQTFEYVGSGTTLSTALPNLGGVPVQANEVVELDGGKVFFTSTDHIGAFRIGSELSIERSTGTITGRAFERSLFATLTPYILAIEG